MKTMRKALGMCIPVLCVLAIFAGPAGAWILTDEYFNVSSTSTALRTNGTGQDWYESRNTTPSTLLFLDTANIGGNSTKKAGFTASTSTNAYLTQEFNPAQSGTFWLQYDIYIDTISDTTLDRAGFQMIGDNSGGTQGPNSTAAERFVMMTFYKDGGATSGGGMSLIAMEAGDTYDDNSTWRVIKTNMNLDQWYTIKLICNLGSDTYDVYVNNILTATNVAAVTPKSSVEYISFAQFNDGAGAFYVDNVVPIPGAVWLLGSGLLGLVAIRRRMKK